MDNKVYDTYLSRDPRMQVKSRVEFPVVKGASDYTTQEIKANSESPSSVDWSFTPPSESTYIARKAYLKSTLTFTCVINTDPLALPDPVPDDFVTFNIGKNVAMQSFVFHRLATNVQCTINNSQVDINMPSYLPAWLQMIDQEELREYSTGCPVMMDRLLKYTDYLVTAPVVDPNGVKIADTYVPSNNSPFNGYEYSSYDSKLLPRGAFPINITNVVRVPAGGDAASVKKLNATTSITVTFSVETYEPILLPPWCTSKWGNNYADAFLGVNRINLRYSLSPSANRALSIAIPNAIVTTTLTGVNNSNLYIQYLNSDATVLTPERCIYNFDQVYNYSSAVGIVANNDVKAINFNNLQLSEIPQLIVLYARQTISTCSAKTSDYFFPISNLSISFNNRVSLLGQFKESDLYFMSKRNGLKNVDFQQFIGYSQKYNPAQESGANGAVNKLLLCGSIIIINPARDLSISNSYLSNSSTGQYNLSWSGSITNNTGAAVDVELVTLLFNSRMLLCASGQSEIIQPALNQEQVAKTISSGAMGYDIPNNMLIGGKNMSSIVNRSIGGASRSGGSRSGGKSKLDSLLM